MRQAQCRCEYVQEQEEDEEGGEEEEESMVEGL
jgi:hypothetical protein